MGEPSSHVVEKTVNRLERLPAHRRRQELSRILNEALTVEEKVARAMALDFNAKLVSRLRERSVNVWGDE